MRQLMEDIITRYFRYVCYPSNTNYEDTQQRNPR